MKRKKFYSFMGVLLLLSFFTTTSFAQGETCADATEITENGTFTIDTLTGTGGTHPSSFTFAAAWYVITFTETGLLSINSCLGGADTRLWIYKGSCDSLIAYADSDDACPHTPDGTGYSYASRLDSVPVHPGTYYIEWDDRWDATGFDFNIEFIPISHREATITVDMSNEEFIDTSGVYFTWMTSQDQDTPYGAPMTDNGNGIWTIDTTFSFFDTIYYLFSNGIGDDDYLEPFENLADCGTAFGGDDDVYVRFALPGANTIVTDTVCFGYCGNCQTYDISFYVNMSLQEVNASGVYLLYTTNPDPDGPPPSVAMTDNGNGIWSTTIQSINGYPLYYLFSNGHLDSIGTHFENGITESCGTEINNSFFTRYIPPVNANTILDTACYNTCGNCEMHDITFSVDMTKEEDDVADTIFLVTINNLLAEEDDEFGIELIPMTDNGDGTWTTTKSILDGTNFHYIFANGNPSINGEVEEVPDLCAFHLITDYEDTLNLRYVNNVTSADTIALVCFNYCSACPPSNDECYDALDISNLFGQGLGIIQSTEIVTLSGATTSEGDPDFGYDCWDDEAIENSIWFHFSGDGNEYHLETTNCDTIGEYCDDTQMALYSGECDNFVAIDCNEDIDYDTDNYLSELDIETASGTEYYMMIDGWNGTEGTFCMTITQTTAPSTSNVTFNVNMSKEETIADSIFIAGSFNDWSNSLMTDNGDNTYSFTTELAIGDTIQYKFKNGPDGWEDGIPADCSLGGYGNRYVVVEATDMNIDLVCFKECADCVVGINDPAFAPGFKIYPNPTTGITNIDFNFDKTTDLTIKLMNNLGQTVRVETLNNIKHGTHQLNLTNVAKGIYNLQIMRGDEILNKQLIID